MAKLEREEMTLDEYKKKWSFPLRHLTPAIGGVCPATGFTDADAKVCTCGNYQLFLDRTRDLKTVMDLKAGGL